VAKSCALLIGCGSGGAISWAQIRNVCLQERLPSPVGHQRHLVVLHDLDVVLLVAVRQPVLRREAQGLLADVHSPYRHHRPDVSLVGGERVPHRQSRPGGPRFRRYIPGGGEDGQVFWIPESLRYDLRHIHRALDRNKTGSLSVLDNKKVRARTVLLSVDCNLSCSTSIDAPRMVPMFPAYYIFNSLLCLLLVLHCFWTYLILKIVANSLNAGKMEGDIRSSSDDYSEDSKSQ
jgi:hypothetical protein